RHLVVDALEVLLEVLVALGDADLVATGRSLGLVAGRSVRGGIFLGFFRLRGLFLGGVRRSSVGLFYFLVVGRLLGAAVTSGGKKRSRSEQAQKELGGGVHRRNPCVRRWPGHRVSINYASRSGRSEEHTSE